MTPDPLHDLRGPDGDLGTNAEYAERILDAQDAAAEAAGIDDDLVAEVTAERDAPSPAYRTPTPTPDHSGRRPTAMQPDVAYLAQRRRERVDALLAVDLDGLATCDLLEHARNLRDATRCYVDAARCLEPTPTPTRRTR